MKKSILLPCIALAWSAGAFASKGLYEVRVDGLACPYCAYGIEKQLDKLDGVKFLDMDLENGVVKVQTDDGVTLSEAQMKELVNNAGFTFRGMQARAQ